MTITFTLQAKTVLFLALLLFLVAYLFQNLLLSFTATIILLFLIYAKYNYQTQPEQITISRTIHESLHYVNHPTNITTTITNHTAPTQLTITDIIPYDSILNTGKNNHSVLLTRGASYDLTYQLIFTARGTHTLNTIELQTTDPWNLFTNSSTIHQPTEIMVHSDPNEIIKATRVSSREHIELTIPSLIGTDLQNDMDGVRDYLPGDLLRDIEWKATSKLQKLMTKLYEKHETIDTTLLVDCSRTMRRTTGTHSKLEHATILALHLTKILQSLRHNVSLIAYDEHKILSKIQPTHHYTPIYHALSELPSLIHTSQTYPFSTPEPLTPNSIDYPQNQQQFLQTIFPFLAKGKRTIQHPIQATGIYEALRLLLLDNKTKHLIILTDMETNPQAFYASINLAHARKYRLWLLMFFSPYYTTTDTLLTSEEIETLYQQKQAREHLMIKLKRKHINIVEITPKIEGGKIIETIRRNTR